MDLYEHQLKAIEDLHNGSILVGDVGTGKSRTALAYYYRKVCNGDFCCNGEGEFKLMTNPRDLYIITTAKKRDSLEWNDECVKFGITVDKESNETGVALCIDSWNNIKKYTDVSGAFFIFDEQRVVGYGAWTKAFLKIVKKNQWILLSATPGDTWSDYIPVFIANGFYRNKSDFYYEHAVFSRYAKYPKIEKYINTGKLNAYRRKVLVHMKFMKHAVQHHETVFAEYNKHLYFRVWRDRWNVYDNCPIQETGKLFYLMRRVVNSDSSRISQLERLLLENERVIIFYNYDYELEIIRDVCSWNNVKAAEWNSHKHENVPSGDRWAYIVQYNAGSEGWNCISTNVMIFYSQSYSYRMTVQAAGRIDRMNTPYDDLYYYHLKSHSPIDVAIARALSEKRDFNESSFIGR